MSAEKYQIVLPIGAPALTKEETDVLYMMADRGVSCTATWPLAEPPAAPLFETVSKLTIMDEAGKVIRRCEVSRKS